MSLFPTKYATDSQANPKMIEFYRARARGGAALIVLDCPCLDYPRAYKGPHELRWDKPDNARSIQELLKAIQAEGCRAFMQLNYPRKRRIDSQMPGAKKKGDVWLLPLANAMSREEAEEILDIMARGARHAAEIGYDGVEIQASYGDLISQLLSPLLNKRKDELGGAVENRARFLVRLIEKVKTAAGPEFPVMVKLVCHEFVEGGLEIEEAKIIAGLVAKAGADAIVANAGNKSTKHITIPTQESAPGPLVDLADQVKSAVSLPVAAIGKINSPDLAEDVIRTGKADFVAMARALVADPELPQKAASGRIKDIRGCMVCLQDCTGKGVPEVGRACGVNPFAGFEHTWSITPTLERKRVLVIGGGPSGMQAAIIADQRGHAVEIWERDRELGGQFRLADQAPYKKERTEVLRYLRHCLDQSEVNVLFEQTFGVSDILDKTPDTVIVATGSRPGRIEVSGIDSDHVISAREVFEMHPDVGKKIVIIGGGDIGCETADWLAGPGKHVSVVEILPELLHTMKKIPRERLLTRLEEKGVAFYTQAQATAIEGRNVHLRKESGEVLCLEADTVILAVPARQEDSLLHALRGKIGQVMAVGDAAKPGNLGTALRSATAAALNI
jgi:2,4-dienoyl-CoA reductase-like NADH-dependent reductase (Old Yellow Enzyme family)/thioredoxin reductase